MRLLLLNWRDGCNPLAGGAEHHITQVFSRLARQGDEICLLSSRYADLTERERSDGFTILRCGGPRHYHLAVPGACRRLLRFWTPDLVVEFMNKLPLFAPLFVRGPVVCFVHHLFGEAAGDELSWPGAAAVRLYERPIPWIYRDIPFLTGSSSSREELVRLGVPAERIRIVPYGVEVSAFSPGRKASRPTVLYMGRLKRYKGLDYLLDAALGLRMRFPGLQVWIAGDGDDRPRVSRLAEAKGLSATVRFMGAVSNEERLRLYQEAWVLCLPSRKEGFGLTVVEGALCETPTVAFDVPGLCDAIQHGQTGLLVSHGDRDALKEALASLLDDDIRRRRMGASARRRYAEFSWDRAAQAMNQALRALRESQPGGVCS